VGPVSFADPKNQKGIQNALKGCKNAYNHAKGFFDAVEILKLWLKLSTD